DRVHGLPESEHCDLHAVVYCAIENERPAVAFDVRQRGRQDLAEEFYVGPPAVDGRACRPPPRNQLNDSLLKRLAPNSCETPRSMLLHCLSTMVLSIIPENVCRRQSYVFTDCAMTADSPPDRQPARRRRCKCACLGRTSRREGNRGAQW